MRTVNLVDAKAHLSRLVDAAMEGEPVRILRRGKVVAQLTGLTGDRKPVDLGALRALTGSMSRQPGAGGETLRAMRDEARY